MKYATVAKVWIGTCVMLMSNLIMSAALAAGLSVGDAAPDFSLAATDGTTVSLRDLVGKQAVVVAWFPKAFTPG